MAPPGPDPRCDRAGGSTSRSASGSAVVADTAADTWPGRELLLLLLLLQVSLGPREGACLLGERLSPRRPCGRAAVAVAVSVGVGGR